MGICVSGRDDDGLFFWNSTYYSCQSHDRIAGMHDFKYDNLGFRVALVSVQRTK